MCATGVIHALRFSVKLTRIIKLTGRSEEIRILSAVLRIWRRLIRAGFERVRLRRTPVCVGAAEAPTPRLSVAKSGRTARGAVRQAESRASASPLGGPNPLAPCPVFAADPSGRDSNCAWLRQSPVSLRGDIKSPLHDPTRRFESSRPEGSKHPKKGPGWVPFSGDLVGARGFEPPTPTTPR